MKAPVFEVFDDHERMFTTSCQRSLFIAKDGVRFESDNKHTFETTDVKIEQIKMNSIFKSFYKLKTGSFRIVLKNGEDDSVIQISPLTDNALKSNMINRPVGK